MHMRQKKFMGLWSNRLGVVGFLILLAACQPKSDEGTSRIVVSGTILNLKDISVPFSYEPYEFLGKSGTANLTIQSDGYYHLVLESASPVKGTVSFGRIPFTYTFTFETVLGTDSTLSVESADFRTVCLWLEPGDSLVMNLDVQRIGETLTFEGRGAVNNRFVNAEAARFDDYKHRYLGNYYQITFREPDDFRRVTDQLRDEKLAFLKEYGRSHRLSPKLVDVYQNDYITDAIRSKINYPSGHAGFNDGKEAILPAGYYDFMDSVETGRDIGSKGLGHYYFLNTYLRQKFAQESAGNNPETGFYPFVKEQLQGSLAYEFLAYALARDFRKVLYDEFGENCPYPDIAARVRERYREMEGMLEGAAAPDFTLRDADGNRVSLSDLKGSFVYIDFWATWCVPCIREIPGLQLIEEEYKDKNIQFVSISYDKETDQEKWRNYFIDNKLSGIQLIADSTTRKRLDQVFNIDLIPRFILIDPDGKIVSANAPRPSSPKLRELFRARGIGQ